MLDLSLVTPELENEHLRASAVNRTFLCPGSRYAQYGLPSVTNDLAEAGTTFHTVLAEYFLRFLGAPVETHKEESPELWGELDERYTRLAAMFIAKAMRIINLNGGAVNVMVEKQFYHVLLRVSGKPDLVVECSNGKWIIFDWKSGFAYVDDPDINLQTRTYVVLIDEKYMIFTLDGVEVDVYIFSPGNDGMFIGPTAYTSEDLGYARDEIHTIRTDSLDPAALRTPCFTACRYCLAFGNPERCPESLKIPVAQTEMIKVVDGETEALTLDRQTEVRTLFEAGKLFEAAFGEFKSWIRVYLFQHEKDGGIKGLALRDTGAIKHVGDGWTPQKILTYAIERGWVKDNEEFISECIAVSPKALIERAIENREKGTTKKAAREAATDLLLESGIMYLKEKTPSVVVQHLDLIED